MLIIPRHELSQGALNEAALREKTKAILDLNITFLDHKYFTNIHSITFRIVKRGQKEEQFKI